MKKILQIQISSSEHSNIISTYNRIGKIYHQIKDYINAISTFEKALQIFDDKMITHI